MTVLAAVLSGIGAVAAGPSARATDIWMLSGPHIEKPFPCTDKCSGWEGVRRDAGDMWKPDAPWEKVAHAVSVIQLPPPNVANARESDLKQALDDINRRHIALALEASLLLRTDQCKSNTEAYSDPGATEFLLNKIKRNGGDLKYIIMDEPYYYGHRYSGPTACHEQPEALAKRIAEMTMVARRVFPGLKVGTVEVVDQSRPWVDDLLAWADTYKRTTGEPLAFFHADVSWSEPAMRNLKPLEEGMRERHIPFGVIYNADAESSFGSDATFVDSTRRHIGEVGPVFGVHPDHAIFQTWVKLPTRMLPETQPGTFTNLVLQYLQPSPALHLIRAGGDLTGRLTDAEGRPVASAQLFGEAVDVFGRMAPIERQTAGKVPAEAASALVEIRANADGACACAGDGIAAVGVMHYAEAGTGRRQDTRPFAKPGNAGPVRQIKVSKNLTDAPNLKQFPVTPGADYTFDAPISASVNAELAGFVSIAFMDAANKPISASMLWFRPSVRRLGVPTTDGDGRFRIAIPPEVTQAGAEVRIYYAGSNALRPQIEAAPR